MEERGHVTILTDGFNKTNSFRRHIRYLFLDSGKEVDKVLSDKKNLYNLLVISPKIRQPSGHDIVIEGEPSSIELGTYAGLGDRVVIRSDETEKSEGHYFSINGNIGEGSTFHWKWNFIGKGVTTDPFVTFHGTKIGDHAVIGTRSVFDTKSEIPQGCEVGDCCYIPHKIESDRVESGTVFFGEYTIKLPVEAINIQSSKYLESFVKMKASFAKDHKDNQLNIGYFDPLAYIENYNKLGNKVENIYVGPFAYINNCEFAGPNVNIQDHNIREASHFAGYNIGAHGVWTKNVHMGERSATLFHAMLENVNLGKDSVAGPLATIMGSSNSDRIDIPPQHVVCGYVTSDNIKGLLKEGEVHEEGDLVAILKPRAEFDKLGLADRLSHIDDENARIHANKQRQVIAVPVSAYFDRENLSQFATVAE